MALLALALAACHTGDTDTVPVDSDSGVEGPLVRTLEDEEAIVGGDITLIGTTVVADGDAVLIGGYSLHSVCRATAGGPVADLPCVSTDQPGDQFGTAITTGDLDDDGAVEWIVGAPGWDQLAFAETLIDIGRVSLIRPDGTAVGTIHGDQALDGAGTAIAVADLTGDGVDDLAIGAPGADLGGANGGVAYILHGPVTGDLSVARDAQTTVQGGGSDLRHGDGPQGDSVGNSLAAGDLDGDGQADLVISAGGVDGEGNDAGEAWVAFGPVPAGHFGRLVAESVVVGVVPSGFLGEPTVVADGDGDGRADLWVATWGVDGTAVALHAPAEWPAELRPEDAQAHVVSHYFGAGLGKAFAVGDLDGDDLPDVVLGAPYDDVGDTPDAGIAYIAHGPLTGAIAADTLDRWEGVHGGDDAGASVAIFSGRLAIGAPYAEGGAGLIYLVSP